MNDLLTAESLIVAILGVFFGLWYSEFTRVMGVKIKKDILWTSEEFYSFANNFLGKIIFLFISQIGLILIFLHETISLISSSYCLLKLITIKKYFALYDTVSTAYCFVFILLIFITIYSFTLMNRIIKKRNDIKKYYGL